MREREYRFERMRPAELLAQRAQAGVAYLPIGPLEWHGPHLPFGVDGLTATAVAERALRETGGVLLPTYFIGTERDRPGARLALLGFGPDEHIVGMDFPRHSLKSCYLDEAIFGLVVQDLLRALARQEWPLVAVVNGHGALNHKAALERVVTAWNQAGGRTRVLQYFVFPEGSPSGLPTDHAAALETSLMLAIDGETVDLGELPPLPAPLPYRDYGIVEGETWAGSPTPDFTVRPAGDPRLRAAATRGEEHLAHAARRLVQLVRAERGRR